MEKKIKSFSWVDYGQSKRVDWWEINIELILNDKNYNLNIIKESYLEGDDSKGSDYRIKDNNGNILYDGLWVKLGWSRYDEIETKGDWMIGDENGLDVWLKIEEEIENDNGWGIWNVEDVNENYLKELFSNTNSDNSVKTEKEIPVKEETKDKKWFEKFTETRYGRKYSELDDEKIYDDLEERLLDNWTSKEQFDKDLLELNLHYKHLKDSSYYHKSDLED